MVPDEERRTPLRSAQLASLGWADHGFGTRQDGGWTSVERTAKLHQVHGADVVGISGPGHHGDGDALITTTAGVWLEIRTADCVPLLIADAAGRVVAAVHAGWRGTAAAIARVTVETLCREWGSTAGDLLVVIGPSIGACCFEVGDDVAARFPGHVSQMEPRSHVDLPGANRDQLIAAGVPEGQVETLGFCTCCNPAGFHSFRRDRGEGRMVTAIRIKDSD